MVGRRGRWIQWSALLDAALHHATLAGAQEVHSASYSSTLTRTLTLTARATACLYFTNALPTPTQVQSVLHHVPRLHQLAPDIFPAYTLPGIRIPDSSISRVEARVSASSIPGPGDAADMMYRGHID